jgi:hypothetical protein
MERFEKEREQWKEILILMGGVMRRRKIGNCNNKECNKNEIMMDRQHSSLGWVCQKNTIFTYGCDMMMGIFGIQGNQ